MMDGAVPLRSMLQADRASEALGMRVLVDDPGHAVVEMLVRGDMLNGFAITHGGLVFALADTAASARVAPGCTTSPCATRPGMWLPRCAAAASRPIAPPRPARDATLIG